MIIIEAMDISTLTQETQLRSHFALVQKLQTPF